MDVDFRKFAQIIEMDSRPRIDQAARGRNHKDTWHSAGRARKGVCVRNLSAKIEAAEKSEYVRDWRAIFAAQLSGKRKLRLIAQNHPGSFPSSVSGREKENPVADAIFHFAIFNPGDDGRKPALPACF
jgi:hypothetical protein